MRVSRRLALGLGSAVIVAGGAAGGWWLLTRANQPESTPSASPPAAPPAAPSVPPAPAPQAAAPAAAPTDPRFAERAIGHADAPVTVTEFYSLTCPHCAAFQRETFARVKSELIDTGKIRMVFWDFPLDQVALTASMVARALPPERYEPFTGALLATQDHWAFARGVNSTEELAKMAALAGLPREAFNKAIADTELKTWIVQRQDQAQKTYAINSTPSFVFAGKGTKIHRESGSIGFDDFAKAVAAAAG